MVDSSPLATEIADRIARRNRLAKLETPLPDKPRIISVSNQKGGVGKTTTAVNLAAAFSRRGAKVLTIDLDPQGNASTALGVEHGADIVSIYDVLIGADTLAEVVQPSTDNENLFCAPSTIHLAGAEIELVSSHRREYRLADAIQELLGEQHFDYVIIDCPPSLGLLTINAFVACHEVLIPIQTEYYALEGLSQLIGNIDLIRKHLNPQLELNTMLLTMYDARTNLSAEVAEEVREHFPTTTLASVIPRSVRISEAPSHGQTVFGYDPRNIGAIAYLEAAHEMAVRGNEREN